MENGSFTSVAKVLIRVCLNRVFYGGALIIVAALASILNFNGKTMSGLLPAYLDFAEFIASGFDLSQGAIVNTFPMWGYGLVFTFTQSKSLVILLQQGLTITVLIFLDWSFERFGWKDRSRLLFRGITLLSFQWFYFHAILWPYSIGANLLLISTCLILHHTIYRKAWVLWLAALSLGIMLNFRSDYFYLGLFMPMILVFNDLIRRRNVLWGHYLSWYLIMFFLLLPWGLYSWEKSGSYLQTSSNGGHVLFISLGQLPDNKWGITPLDGDPKMRSLVDSELGPGTNTLTHQADTFLTRKWLELIVEDKTEFLRKCWFNLRSILRSSFYYGELYTSSEGYADRVIYSSIDRKVQSLADQLATTTTIQTAFLPIKAVYRFIGSFLVSITALALVLTMTMYPSSFRDHPIIMVVCSIVLYQMALLVLAYNMFHYHTNIFIHYVVLLVFVISEINPLAEPFNWGRKRIRGLEG